MYVLKAIGTALFIGFLSLPTLGVAQKPAGQWTLRDTEVKFGVSLQTEAGVVVARAQAGATFEVTLRWTAPGEPGG